MLWSHSQRQVPKRAERSELVEEQRPVLGLAFGSAPWELSPALAEVRSEELHGELPGEQAGEELGEQTPVEAELDSLRMLAKLHPNLTPERSWSFLEPICQKWYARGFDRSTLVTVRVGIFLTIARSQRHAVDPIVACVAIVDVLFQVVFSVGWE